MPDIELIVTDLDGTFWHGHEVIHASHVPAWRELERRGVRVMVATGRRLASTRDPLARAGLRPPAVVLNGALVVDLSSSERVHRHPYDPPVARAVLEQFRAHGLEPCVYVDHPNVDVFHGNQPSTHREHLASLGPTAAHANLDDVVGEVPVLMFGIIGHPLDPLPRLVANLDDTAEAHLGGHDQWGGYSITVTPPGLSKWVGVTRYCAQAGIDPAHVLAIGDGPNDLELLDAAAVAVVPSNGCAEALHRADHVVAPPSEGGWATLLDLV